MDTSPPILATSGSLHSVLKFILICSFKTKHFYFLDKRSKSGVIIFSCLLCYLQIIAKDHENLEIIHTQGRNIFLDMVNFNAGYQFEFIIHI